MSKPHKRWSKQRRFEAAVLRVIDDGWTQVEAAKEYDVSRQHLNKKVKEARLEREVRVDEAKAKIKIAPPSSEDRTFGGSVIFHAIMDQKGFDDVRDGIFKVKFRNL